LGQSEVCDAANHPHSAEEYFDRYDSVRRMHAEGQADNGYGPCRGWTMTVSDYVVISNDWRNATASRAQLQTAWSSYSKRDTDARPTARRKLFTGTWACLLMHRRPRKLWHSRSSLVGSRRTKQMLKTVSSAQQLLDFFNAKGNAVQTTLGQTPAV